MPAPEITSSPLAAAVRRLLGTRRFGRPLHVFASLPSTNPVALAEAERGAPEGTTVVADHQTAGRGRLGRTWEAAAGLNLTFSIVLRPRCALEAFGLIPVAAAVAVAETLDAYAAPHRVTIKWPNDVLIDGHKCCGMLMESTFRTPSAAPALALGIGLNVNQVHFPDSIAEHATSLLLITGQTVDRPSLLADLLQRLETRYAAVRNNPDALRRRYLERLEGLGRPVRLRATATDQPVNGILRGITPTGALRLGTSDGERVFHAGDVTTQGADA